MKTISGVKLFLVVLSLSNFNPFFGQSDIEQKEYYKWFDDILGIGNAGLYNGLEYIEEYRTIDENHQFFLSKRFIVGNVMYDGQPYFDIEMSYDIYKDELTVKLPDRYGYLGIRLIKEKVKSFSIENHQFINITLPNEEKVSENDLGFYELISQEIHFTFFKKHKKRKERIVDKEYVYYKFKDKAEYLININDSYYKISSKRDLAKLFPKYKKNINNFYTYNRKLLNSNRDEFMKQLMNNISGLINIKTITR